MRKFIHCKQNQDSDCFKIYVILDKYTLYAKILLTFLNEGVISGAWKISDNQAVIKFLSRMKIKPKNTSGRIGGKSRPISSRRIATFYTRDCIQRSGLGNVSAHHLTIIQQM